MLSKIRKVLQEKEIRGRILYTAFILFLFRAGCVLPVPEADSTFFSSLLSGTQGDALKWLSAMTGGSMERMSIFALGISPYITASIIIELLAAAIPRLEETIKDGEEGKRKLHKYTRYLTAALALIESLSLAVSLGSRGLLRVFTPLTATCAVISMTAGTAVLLFLSELIDEKGLGNGISMILLVNILSSLGGDVRTIGTVMLYGKSLPAAVTFAFIILLFIYGLIIFSYLLCESVRKVPVLYSGKLSGEGKTGANASHIPFKVNTAGVIPVIFTSSVLSMPVIIGELLGADYGRMPGKLLLYLSSSNWFHPARPYLTIGVLIYAALTIFFAYFYTSITINPYEIADNFKRAGATVPGIRPGRPTAEYLDKILSRLVFIGASGLLISCIVPVALTNLSGTGSLSFLGTSLLIIVSVLLETAKKIEAEMHIHRANLLALPDKKGVLS